MIHEMRRRGESGWTDLHLRLAHEHDLTPGLLIDAVLYAWPDATIRFAMLIDTPDGLAMMEAEYIRAIELWKNGGEALYMADLMAKLNPFKE